jgi:glycyl-tRNA synthetase
MEMEFFVKPEEAEMQRWYEFWVAERFQWFQDLGIRADKLRQRVHNQDELAHYAKGCVDVEYEFPFGWSELEGIANRSNYDLSQHIKTSGKDLSYFDEATKEKYVPAVVETAKTPYLPTVWPTRTTTVEGEERVVMRFSSVAPVRVLPRCRVFTNWR